MKNFMIVAVVAIAMCMASCSNSVKETPMSDNLIKVSQTVEGKTLNGIKTTEGKELVPMKYADVFSAEGYLIAKNDRDTYVYTLEGTLVNNNPASDLVFYNDYIKLYADGKTSVYFKKNKKLTGPYTTVGADSDFLFCESDSVEVYTQSGEKAIGGQKVILLFSKPEAKHYFIVVSGETAKAYEKDGTYLFDVDAKLLEKLPKASWKANENMQQVNSRNEIVAFKAKKNAKKATKKRK